MKPDDLPSEAQQDDAETDPLGSLLRSPISASGPAYAQSAAPGLAISPVVGELLALVDGNVPVVRWPGQVTPQAVRARSIVDLHGQHIGFGVLVLFEMADPERPIVIGVLREASAWPLAEPPAQVQVDSDGQRMVVTAREQLVLRCGKACITLTRAGKVLIEGSYVSSRSTGVNRVKGGSVQLN
jgi:hypothetical protein